MSHGLDTEGDTGATVLTEIVDQHAANGSFLWTLRDTAAGSPTANLAALSRLDNRVDANLDGLRISGDVGVRIARAELDAGGGGEAFVAAVLAIERSDIRTMAEILARGVGAPVIAREIVSALGWVPFPRVEPLLRDLLSGDSPPELRVFGIAGFAAHRCDPGALLGSATRSSDLRLKARALRAVGELGRTDLLPEVRRELGADDEVCRFSAAWSAALLGEPAARATLWALGRAHGPFSERAATLVVRREDPSTAYASVRDIADVPGRRRIALACCAALGDPALVPWIIEHAAIPAEARFAGWALTMITGCDLVGEGLSAPPPDGSVTGPSDDPGDDLVAVDPDGHLPWPNVTAVEAWWTFRASSFRRGTRYLWGTRMDEAVGLQHVLRSGPQCARAAASLELCLRAPGSPLFEVRAPAPRQHRSLPAKEGVPCGGS